MMGIISTSGPILGPSSPSRKVITRRGNSTLTKVSELINPTTNVWDADLINDIFWPVDAQRILQISIARAGVDDFVAWHYNKSGVFSVRSAYHVEWDHQHGEKLRRTNGMGGTRGHPVWKKIWELKVPVKVKIFGWKSLHNTVPCLATLANRHVPVSAKCGNCPSEVEDLRHVLFTCGRARAVWTDLGVVESIDRSLVLDRAGSAVLEDLLAGDQASNIYISLVTFGDLVAVTYWYI